MAIYPNSSISFAMQIMYIPIYKMEEEQHLCMREALFLLFLCCILEYGGGW